MDAVQRMKDMLKGYVLRLANHLSWFVFSLSPLLAMVKLIPSNADIEHLFDSNLTKNYTMALYVYRDKNWETVLCTVYLYHHVMVPLC